MTEFGEFSFKVIKRLLDILAQEGPLKRTNLALKAKLNFTVCMRYLELLDALEWSEVADTVTVTAEGRKIKDVLFDSDSFKNPAKSKKEVQPSEPESGKQSEATRPKLNENLLIAPKTTKVDSWKEKIGRVIIVDDEPDVAFTFQSFLSGVCSASAFSDPFEALKAFSAQTRDVELVVLDIRIPEVTGLQLYQIFKVLNKECKFLFVSSLDAARELLSIFPEIGPTEIVRKPIDREAFVQAVMNSLSRNKT